VRLLGSARRRTWAAAIEAETDRDVTAPIRLAGHVVTTDSAKEVADVVARAIADTRLAALEKHALHAIQDWKNADDQIADKLAARLVAGKTTLPPGLAEDAYATHVVAAAVTAAVLGQASPNDLQSNMIAMLKHMHDDNPSWGPMYVSHRGDVRRHVIARRPRLGVAD
jgi:hypothetical protein